MKPETIQKLLDRYFEGHSSLEEEQQLRHYFTETEVAEELLMYQAIFQVLQSEQAIQLPESFEASFLELIKNQGTGTPVRSIRRPFRSWLASAAAIAILVFGLAWVLQPQIANTETASSIDWSQYEPDNPEEAIEYYKQAMLKLGAALNNGASKAGHNIKHVEEVGQFFQ